jgi:hypothetical protein
MMRTNIEQQNSTWIERCKKRVGHIFRQVSKPTTKFNQQGTVKYREFISFKFSIKYTQAIHCRLCDVSFNVCFHQIFLFLSY